MATTVRIPLFVGHIQKTTYYMLHLNAERMPGVSLHYAYEHYEVYLSPSLRPCDHRNGKALQLRDMELAAELAAYAEPIMQRRYGRHTEVTVQEWSCPAEWLPPSKLKPHAEKAKALILEFESSGAQRSINCKKLELATVTPIK